MYDDLVLGSGAKPAVTKRGSVPSYGLSAIVTVSRFDLVLIPNRYEQRAMAANIVHDHNRR